MDRGGPLAAVDAARNGMIRLLPAAGLDGSGTGFTPNTLNWASPLWPALSGVNHMCSLWRV